MAAGPPSRTIRARNPRGGIGAFRRDRDPDVVAGFLQDAARTTGGHCDEICFPTSEAEVAAILAEGRAVLAIGAQSSLTGGATPHGETLVSMMRFRDLGPWTDTHVDAGVGLLLRELEAAAAARDLYFPPVPTYDGASVGGVISTDAAGAATFKHGTTRAWVDGLTALLSWGDAIDVERGQAVASAGECFEIVTTAGRTVSVPVPAPARPAVPKVSAGYRGGPALDLVDLLVGSEGTLAIVTSAKLRLLGPRPQWLAALIPVANDAQAVALTGDLRSEALRTRASGDADGADVAAVEYMDARCLAVLREDGAPSRLGIPLPADAEALLLVQLELPATYDRARAVEELADHHEGSVRGPVATLCRILERHGVLDRAIPALPGEEERRRALFALREAVPEGVNRRVRDAQLATGGAVSKSGGDVIVPFERFAESLARYRAILAGHGLDAAVWGHISDGNVHPNVVARSAEEMAAAKRAQIEIGKAAIELGGSPMAEHGTGRSPIKRQLLAALHGEAGVASMVATKRALDPDWRLAPGVLF